jgi:hypothetical protein
MFAQWIKSSITMLIQSQRSPMPTFRYVLAEIPKVKDIVTNYERKFSQWSARHHYFSVASQASVGGNLLSRKELTGLFDQWRKSLQYDSGIIPYSASVSDSILSALKSAYPTVQLAKSTDKPTLLASCYTTLALRKAGAVVTKAKHKLFIKNALLKC